jgi:hypothetical protein
LLRPVPSPLAEQKQRRDSSTGIIVCDNQKACHEKLRLTFLAPFNDLNNQAL